MSHPLDAVWSALSDASNALDAAVDATNSIRYTPYMADLLAIDRAIDAATRLVIARIEEDNRELKGD